LKVSFEKINLIYDLRILDCGDSWVELHLWAIPSQYTKNKNLFNQIRESLQLANSATPLLNGNQAHQLPANRSSAPGLYEVIIWTGIGLVFLAIAIAAIQRLRKRLSADVNPTWKTYVNELGGYIIVLILILLGGIAVLLDNSEPQHPPAPVQNDNSF
ncbi:MAG: hypothetical protein KDA77_14265, partial [Planctomycetaceae bacterium]|nr:hypothetical protein [Planctomycetaceae bacterium]